MIKKLLSITSSLFSASLMFSQVLIWGSEINVTSTSGFGNMHPRIALTTGGIPVVLWGGGNGTQPLYVARWNGTSFSTPVMITPMGVDPFIDNWAGPAIAASGNNVYVVFKRQPEMMSYIYTVKSTDGGVTFADTVLVDAMQGPTSRFPNITVDAAGNPVVLFMDFNSSWLAATQVVTNSPDGGMTYPMASDASGIGGSEVCDCCPGSILVSGNTQIASFRRNNNNLRDMWAGISSNGGMTFPIGGDLDNTNWYISMCPSTGPECFLNGDSLYTVFMSESFGPTRVYISSRNINTQAFGFCDELANNFSVNDIQNYPQISGNADTVGTVWQQQNSSGSLDAYFAWSVNGGAGNVENEMMLNSTMMGDQRNPDVAYSNGIFHFVYQNDATGRVVYKTATFDLSGINENSYSADISVSPNPSSGIFTIQSPQGKLEIYNTLGELIFSSPITNNSININLSEAAKGIYFLIIRANNKTYTQKLIIQ